MDAIELSSCNFASNCWTFTNFQRLALCDVIVDVLLPLPSTRRWRAVASWLEASNGSGIGAVVATVESELAVDAVGSVRGMVQFSSRRAARRGDWWPARVGSLDLGVLLLVAHARCNKMFGEMAPDPAAAPAPVWVCSCHRL